MASRIWKRLLVQETAKESILANIVVSNDLEFEAKRGILAPQKQRCGKWKAYGVNSHFRICCYPGRGHFSAHRDADYQVDQHHCSLLTINGYLTDRPSDEDGATRLLKDDVSCQIDSTKRFFETPPEAVLHRIKADKAGKAVVFRHGLMHDGEPLTAGSSDKWLFRTEIMFERDPTTAPQISQAQVLHQKAEQAEMRGDVREAMRLYNHAFKLDPTLE